MSSEAPDFGFKPSNRYQKEQVAFLAYKDTIGKDMIFNEFIASNMHLALQAPLNILDDYEGRMVKLQADMFALFESEARQIKGSYGAAREGWYNVFADYCDGLNIVDFYKDPIRADDWPLDKLIDNKPIWQTPIRRIFEEILKEKKATIVGRAPGEFEVYFDNLKADAPLEELFKRVVGAAEYTIGGDKEVLVRFSDGVERGYYYTNLLPQNYTKIDIQANIKYKRQGITYSDAQIKENIQKNFNLTNRIGQDVYPNNLICMQELDGIESAVVKHSNAGQGQWIEGNIQATPGQKYVIESIMVEIV